jgi:hypothetical protein
MNDEIKNSLYIILEGLQFLRSRHSGLYMGIDVLNMYTSFSSPGESEAQKPDALSEDDFKEVLRSMRQFSEKAIQTTAQISEEVDKLFKLLGDSN